MCTKKNRNFATKKKHQKMDEIKRIEQLRKELHEHNYKYYVLNQPTIGDQEFDFMMHELQGLEAKHPEMADPNSPTQRVGSDLNAEFQQVEHKYPMLSLANTYNEQDVVEMKMQNIHDFDYPKEKLHVIWVTDGSTDDTNERLKAYPDVEVVYSPERRGKTAPLNHGISAMI